MFDAILATPNYRTPVLPDSALATAPGLEQAVPTPQFTLNALAPALYNSNAQFLSSGGSKTLEGSPLVRLGWASQLFDTPIRVSGAAASKPRGLSTPPAPLLTTSGLRPGHSTSIPKTTRIIRRSCPLCRGWISIPPLRTTLPRDKIWPSVSTKFSTSTAPSTGSQPRPTARARRSGRSASASAASAASAIRLHSPMPSFSAHPRHTSFPRNGMPASRCRLRGVGSICSTKSVNGT